MHEVRSSVLEAVGSMGIPSQCRRLSFHTRLSALGFSVLGSKKTELKVISTEPPLKSSAVRPK